MPGGYFSVLNSVRKVEDRSNNYWFLAYDFYVFNTCAFPPTFAEERLNSNLTQLDGLPPTDTIEHRWGLPSFPVLLRGLGVAPFFDKAVIFDALFVQRKLLLFVFELGYGNSINIPFVCGPFWLM